MECDYKIQLCELERRAHKRRPRRTAGRCCFAADGNHGSDHQVREMLGVVSFQWVRFQRRLLLLSSLLRHGPDHMLTLLAAQNGLEKHQPLPWVRLVLSDLDLFWQYHRSMFYEFSSPLDFPERWAHFCASGRHHPGTCRLISLDVPRARLALHQKERF